LSEHVHSFRLQVEGPDCDKCQYSAIVGLAACACGELLSPTAIERRLNAVEQLSADDAQRLSNTCMSMQGEAIHDTKFPSLRASAVAYWKSRVVKLRAYASALEAETNEERIHREMEEDADQPEYGGFR